GGRWRDPGNSGGVVDSIELSIGTYDSYPYQACVLLPVLHACCMGARSMLAASRGCPSVPVVPVVLMSHSACLIVCVPKYTGTYWDKWDRGLFSMAWPSQLLQPVPVAYWDGCFARLPRAAGSASRAPVGAPGSAPSRAP